MWLTAASAIAAPDCPPTPIISRSMLKSLAIKAQPDRGFLWIAIKGKNFSYLYGTIHVAKIDWDFPGPTIRRALSVSKTVAVEVDTSKPSFVSELNREVEASEQPGQKELKTYLEDQVNELIRESCLSEKQFENMSLSSKIASLTLLSARDEGYYPDFSIDSSLIGYAKTQAKNVFELETTASQASTIAVDLSTAANYVEQIKNGQAKQDVLKLAKAWELGDLALLESSNLCNCETIHKYTDNSPKRNLALANAIAETFSDSDNVFVAIGVLHMIGPQGVIAELKRMGYSVYRVPFPTR